MTVGQGDSRSKLDAEKDIIRVPPPVDISSAPSHALAGKYNKHLKIEYLYNLNLMCNFEFHTIQLEHKNYQI